ncbi:ATP-binding cassette sub-family A member 17 isoform X2 [Drosophila busckii]|uniref:ATP-binding cassette sub-family A member 17 isoform X2 n=1 Tax=Drosophila busckii TaxID=30019 RepID=UPI00083F2796|nr:ATP-binding cassette sub-family A member 17 isoform X2 [Drosophila busckii]
MSSNFVMPPLLRSSSTCKKLCVLIKKNFRILFTSPLSIAVILIVPIVLFLLAHFDLITTAVKPTLRGENKFTKLDLDTEVKSIFYYPNNSIITNLIEKLAIELHTDKVETYASSSAFENALTTKDAFVGIEFSEDLTNVTKLPHKLTIILRFPDFLRSRSGKMWKTGIFYKIFVEKLETKPTYYAEEGFLIIQAKLSRLLIRKNTDDLNPEDPDERMPSVSVNGFPERKHTDYSYLYKYHKRFRILIPILFVGPMLMLGYRVVTEKHGQLRDLIHIMGGVSVVINWLSWSITVFASLLILTFILVVLVKAYLCPFSSILVLFLIFLLYILTLTWYILMICACFKAPVVTVIIIFIIFSISLVPDMMKFNVVTDYVRSIVNSFFMNSAMLEAMRHVYVYEQNRKGIHWSNLFQVSIPQLYLSPGVVIFNMFSTNIILILICLYADQLHLGKPWYFPCRCLALKRKRKPRQKAGGDSGIEWPTGSRWIQQFNVFELDTTNRTAIIETKSLTKVFGEHVAVANINLKLYEDEITVLLGTNGAGKSTIFKILSGMLAPSSGTVLINGHDMAITPKLARKSLAICPQANVLFGQMSARWHIEFYSQLKGLSRRDAQVEASQYLEKVNMLNRGGTKVNKLSAGMRRRLMLCCALCANSKEPMANLDLTARKVIRELLLEKKAGRCILATTHSIEVAELLADRVAIMCDGKIYALGSIDFLITQLSPGYRLVCEQLEDCDVEKVTRFLQRYIRFVQLESIRETYLTYRLPIKDVFQFQKLFKALEGNASQLKLSNYSVAAPNLSDAFTQITTSRFVARSANSMNALMVKQVNRKELNPWKKCCNDWRGLMLRKLIYTKHNMLMLVLLMGLPILIYILIKILHIDSMQTLPSALNIADLTPYNNPLILCDWRNSKGDENLIEILRSYESIAKAAGATVRRINETFKDYMLYNVEDDSDYTIVAAVSVEEFYILAWFNPLLEHSAPLSLALVYNAIGQRFGKTTIDVVNKPRRIANPVEYQENKIYLNFFSALVIIYCCLLMGFFALLPIEERAIHLRQQLLNSGISVWSYWLSHLLWDMFVYVLMALVVLLTLPHKFGRAFYLLMVYFLIFGFASLSFTYLISLIFLDSVNGMSIVLIINWIFVFTAMITDIERAFRDAFNIFAMVVPSNALYQAIMGSLKYGNKQSCVTESTCKPVIFAKPFIYMFFSGIVYFLLVVLLTKLFHAGYTIRRSDEIEYVPEEGVDVNEERERVENLVKDETLLRNCSLVIDRATKVYNQTVAVNNLSLEVWPTECFCLLGPNGAGKTSTFDMIVGNKSITHGNIYVKGYSVKHHLHRCGNQIGFAAREPKIYTFMTGRENLRFACLTVGIKTESIKVTIAYVADSCMITPYLDQKAKTYNAVTKQKLNIAIATLSPTLICLDEPTAGVDTTARDEICLLLADLRDSGRSLFVTSHNMHECELLCTRLGLIVKGKLLCLGTLEHLKQRFNKGITVKIQVANRERLDTSKSLVFTSELSIDRSSRSMFSNRSHETVSSAEGNSKSTQTQRGINKIKSSVTISASPPTIFTQSTSESDLDSLSENLDESSPRYWQDLINRVILTFKRDFPGSYVKEKCYILGLVSLIIPDANIKWSEIFSYVEQHRSHLQIWHYSISQMTLEDIVLEFTNRQNDV